MLQVWLALVVVILLTRALHCYLHYRAGREGVAMPTHGTDGEPLNQVIQEVAHADPETQPSQTQSDKKRQRSPRRRRTSKTAQAV